MVKSCYNILGQPSLLHYLLWNFSCLFFFNRLSETLTKDSARIKANIRMVLEVMGCGQQSFYFGGERWGDVVDGIHSSGRQSKK